MAYGQLKLKAAVKEGFIPPEITKSMVENNHVADVYVLDEIRDEQVGVGYDVVTEFEDREPFTVRHITWYTAEEIDEMLKDE
jgi:hypothetical protein